MLPAMALTVKGFYQTGRQTDRDTDNGTNTGQMYPYMLSCKVLVVHL